jgi:hypothetical protein
MSAKTMAAGGKAVRIAALAALILGIAPGGVPAEARDRAVARRFQYEHPCPATGLRAGGCPGWVRDHVIPLCAGGADSIANMQWQSATEARIKDRSERALCRTLRHDEMRRRGNA